MLEMVTAQAEGLDPTDVAGRLTERLQVALAGRTPALLLLYAAARPRAEDHTPILSALRTAWPQALVCGTTSAGDFASPWGLTEDGATVTALVSDAAPFACARASCGEDVTSTLTQAQATLGTPATCCMVLADPLCFDCSALMRDTQAALPPRCVVVGGGSGHLRDEPDVPFAQFCGGAVYTESAVFVLAGAPLAARTLLSHTWRTVGPVEPVTRMEGRTVLEVGGRPALDFYRHYLGAVDRPTTEFPLAVFTPANDSAGSGGANGGTDTGDDEFFIAGVTAFDEARGGLRLVVRLAEGAHVGITEVLPETLLAETGHTTRRLWRTMADEWPAFRPAGLVTFSCSARKRALGTRADEELARMAAELPHHMPIGGFHAWGEFAPARPGGPARLHHGTLVLTMLGEAPEPDKAGHVEADGPTFSPQRVALGVTHLPGAMEGEEAAREIAFLRKKLARSEFNRERLEVNRQMHATMFRRMHLELTTVNDRLRASEQRVRSIIETTSEGFILIGPDEKIAEVNGAICRLLGYSREELIGTSTADLHTPASRRMLEANREELLGREFRAFEAEYLRKDGTTISLHVTANTLREPIEEQDEPGEIIGHIGFYADLTEHKKALQLAGEVQRAFLPGAPPRLPGLDIAGVCQPSTEVGGDYLDYLCEIQPPAPGAGTCMVVGDVSGHGVDAALLMSAARAFLRTMAHNDMADISHVITRLNGQLARDVGTSGRFMSMVLMRITLSGAGTDPTLEYVRAGHDPILRYHIPDDTFEELTTGDDTGVPLGVLPGFGYHSVSVTLRPGDVLVAGTDGIWEAHDPQRRMYTKARLRETLRRLLTDAPKLSASDIVDGLLADVQRHTTGLPPDDDRTLLVCRVLHPNR